MEGVHNVTDLSEIEASIAEIAADIVALDALIDGLILDVANIDADIVLLQADVTDILTVTNALPTLSETGGTVTTDGTEQNVYINAAPLGVFNPLCVKIDCTAHTATETIVINLYYDVAPGGAGLLLADTLTFAGAITPPILTIDLDPNRYGVRVTIQKTAGTNRVYPWEALYEI
jgi:hypothetical protein